MTGYRWEDFIPERLVSLEQGRSKNRSGGGGVTLVGSLLHRFGGRQGGTREQADRE